MRLKLRKIAFALRALSSMWPASIKFIRTKARFYIRKELNSQRICTRTWLQFHCYRAPIWPWWRHLKMLFAKKVIALPIILAKAFWTLSRIFIWNLFFSTLLVHKEGGFTWIGHFRVPKILTFRTRLSATPFLWKRVLFAWNHFHINGLALSLALKQRLGATQKWPIEGAHDPQAPACCSFHVSKTKFSKTFDQDCKCQKSRQRFYYIKIGPT